MKIHTQWFVVGWVFLSGCMATETTDPGAGSEKIPVQFNLGLKTEVLPFPTLRSIPDFGIPEPEAPHGEPDTPPDGDEGSDLSDICTRVEYLVYRAGEADKPFKCKQFNLADADTDFGIVYDSLPAGPYRFVFIAHSSAESELAEQMLQVDEVSDTFYAAQEREIRLSGEGEATDIALRRTVCRIECVSTEPVPADLKDFEIRIERYPASLHTGNGLGAKASDIQAFLHAFTAEEAGKLSFTHAFYTFIPPDKGTIDLCLTARNRDGKVVRERKITGVTPLANRIIRYSGRLYTPSASDDTFRLDVYEGGKWESVEEVVLPD